jgi:hypothetical protein
MNRATITRPTYTLRPQDIDEYKLLCRRGSRPAAGSPFRDGPLRQLADVERLTTDYLHWYNHDRLHGELRYVTPEEYEQAYYAAPPDPPPGESSRRKTA